MTVLNIKVGGEAGQGVQSAGFLLSKAFVRCGYHVFAIQDAMSRIRGGHNFFQIRVAEEPIGAMTREVDVLLGLDHDTLHLHRAELAPDGLAVLDAGDSGLKAEDPSVIDVPLRQLARRGGDKAILANAAAVGFVFGLTSLPFETLKALFSETFSSEALLNGNTLAAEAGYEHARKRFSGRFRTVLTARDAPRRMFLTGNHAICLGAIAANCRFCSAYPMSPSTPIMEYLAKKQKALGLVVEQAEDEIAAANLAFGASVAGVRSMVATSGGGLALMSETISLLGATEVPLVLVDCQRPGPATGLPTRTEQGDLLFVIHTGHGEIPRAVLAPGDAQQAFYSTINAFNLADRFQIPVFVLSDQHLSDSYFTIDPFDLEEVRYVTSLMSEAELSSTRAYCRYRDTEDGVSPRAYPGQSRHLVCIGSDEHDEIGLITEDASMRTRMVKKRLRKLAPLGLHIEGPELIGPKQSPTLVLGWGSARQVLMEVVAILGEKGLDVGLLHFGALWPFPDATTRQAVAHNPRLVCVEGNATGQLAYLVSHYTGRRDIESIHRFDGRPFIVDELVEDLEKELR